MAATRVTEATGPLTSEPAPAADPERGPDRWHRSDVWPASREHNLCLLDLTADRERAGAGVVRLADQLASLADASWALERAPGAANGVLGSELRRAGAEALWQLGRQVGGELERTLSSRAAAVAVGDWENNARLTAECTDDRVAAVYGPLKTWSSKDDACRFGALVSVESHAERATLDAADRVLDDAVATVARECAAGDLGFWHVPGYVTADVIACGGEANTFPKHFALFLPEDAGVADRACPTKTVVYVNVYVAQFLGISSAVGRCVLDPWHPVPSSSVTRTLLTWFRGHDVSHFLGPGGRYADHLVGWDGRLRGALQEAFADVVGFLVMSSPPVLAEARVDPTDLSLTFLCEMLRYYRRGWAWFPDSHAARLELTYLLDGGWLTLAEEGHGGGVRLRWEPEKLRDGMVSLGTELCAALVRGDAEAAGWLRHLCEHEPAWLADFQTRLRDQTRTVGDSLAFAHRS